MSDVSLPDPPALRDLNFFVGGQVSRDDVSVVSSRTTLVGLLGGEVITVAVSSDVLETVFSRSIMQGLMKISLFGV